jgi:hypothetical protein
MNVLNGRTIPTNWVSSNLSGCPKKKDPSMNFYEYLTLLDLDEWFDADDHIERGSGFTFSSI